jgi:hypothetical protein
MHAHTHYFDINGEHGEPLDTVESILPHKLQSLLYQLTAGSGLVSYQHLPHKLLLLRIIHKYVQDSENICIAYFRSEVTRHRTYAESFGITS